MNLEWKRTIPPKFAHSDYRIHNNMYIVSNILYLHLFNIVKASKENDCD